MPHKFGAQFWFKSPLFDIEPGEDEQTNPLCYGRQFANWLRAKLLARGYDVEEVIPEDWGWCVMCARKPFMLWVGCVSVHDYNKTKPEDPLPRAKDITWACSVTAETPLLAGLFKRIDVEPKLGELSKHVEAILRAEPDIAFTEQP